ncbi:nitroreductase family protein [Amycolatopsis thermalba]|uniref:Nitroreductase family protein n=1 Tax=Amycolatopsis thermalba TaxID=944492 RepID=A0ABY4NRH8_9PSEU|nr:MULTISPECIES: nitroreductase family protein [Amycolatopsis]UQS22671.1 nitroreductase family protein [Amycolatopsis thermalba]
MTLPIDEVLTTTRAVRRRLRFDRPVAPEVIRECLEVAVQAPSGGNRQPWRWIVVRDAEQRARIAEVYRRCFAEYVAELGDPGPSRDLDSARFLADNLHRVPVLVLPCLVASRLPEGSQAGLWGSLLPAAWSYLLAARARGLGTVWTTCHLRREAEVAEILGLPPGIRQGALIPTAYHDGGPFRPARRAPLADVLVVDRWRRTRELVADLDDPFFFDHELDHLPGMLLLSAALDLVRPAGAEPAVVLTLDFRGMGELDAPVQLTAEPSESSTGRWRVEAGQEGRTIMTGTIEVGATAEWPLGSLGDPAWPADSGAVEVGAAVEWPVDSVEDPVRSAGSGAVEVGAAVEWPVGSVEDPRRVVRPVDRRLVHRRRAENVVVGDLAESEQDWRVTVLPPPAGHHLDGGRTAERLIEAARQFVTLLEYADNQRQEGTRFVLTRLAATVPAGPSTGAVLSWAKTGTRGNRPRYDVRILDADGQCVGSVTVCGRALSDAAFRRLRGRTAPQPAAL